MNPRKVDRNRLVALTDLPNIGKAAAADLDVIGVRTPADLIGRSPLQMYQRLCAVTGVRHDPCVIDVFISVTRFMGGEDARDWWAYTEERKRVTSNAGSKPASGDAGGHD